MWSICLVDGPYICMSFAFNILSTIQKKSFLFYVIFNLILLEILQHDDVHPLPATLMISYIISVKTDTIIIVGCK